MTAISRRSFLQHSGLAGAAMLASVGCNRQAAPQGNTAAELQTLRLGFNLWSGFMPWQVAKEKNFFQNNNLNGELTWFPALSDQLSAFNSGRLDAVGITLSDFLNSVVGGVKAKVVSLIDLSLGADAIVASPAVKSLSDMAGKTASVEIGTVGHLLFLKALEAAGLNEDSVKIVNQTADVAIATLIAGRTDICASYEPFVSQAVASGKGKVIFSSRDVPGLVSDLLVVQQSLLDRQPDAVQNLLKVWYQTLDYRQSHQDEVLPIEAKQAGVSVADYQKLLEGFKWVTPQDALASFQPGQTTESQVYTAKIVSDFMVKQKLLTQAAPDFAGLIDDRFLKQYIG